MRVRVTYHAQIRSVVGRSSDELELPEGASVLALLSQIADHNPEPVRGHLFATSGAIRPSLMVIVNNSPQPHESAAAAMLKDGDAISLLPPIAGG